MKTLKILKINLLSLIALPLLLLATAGKLTAKALEKAALLLGMLILTVLVFIGFEFFRNPSAFGSVFLALIVFAIIFALVTAILIFLATLAASLAVTVWTWIISLFDGIYNLTYSGFLKLYTVCENDYELISLGGSRPLNACLCFFYTLLHFVNRLIQTVISLALPLSIGLSLFLTGDVLIGMHLQFKKLYGIGLAAYVSRMTLFDRVYGITAVVLLLADGVLALLSLGIEWHEWARELRETSDQLDEGIRRLQNSDWHIAQDESAAQGTGDANMHNQQQNLQQNLLQDLQEHIKNLGPLGDQVEDVLSAGENPLLRNAWNTYFRNLSEITQECSRYKKGIPQDRFKKLIPRIQQLEKQREDVKKRIADLQEAAKDPVKASLFFSGCTTPEKLENRYKSLCKAYHPDTAGGDTESFQKLQAEYTALKEYLARQSG